MPSSRSVRLPQDHRPLFPTRCIACSEPVPDSTLRVHSSDWNVSGFLRLISGRRLFVDVPACSSCCRSYRTGSWLRFLTLWIVVGICMLAAREVLAGYQGPFKRWLTGMLGLVFTSPYVVWSVYFPMAIELSTESDFLIYEIRDADYATDFVMLNYAAAKRANR